MRRKLRKDNDLVKELYAIIQKYLPILLNKFENLTNTRNQSYITYNFRFVVKTCKPLYYKGLHVLFYLVQCCIFE